MRRYSWSGSTPVWLGLFARQGERQRLHRAVRRLAGQPARVVHGVDHLAVPQRGITSSTRCRSMRNTMPRQLPPVSSANTRPGHWRAPVHAAPHLQRPVPAVHFGGPLLGVIKVGPPDERAVAKQPEVLVGFHCASVWASMAAGRGAGGVGRVSCRGVAVSGLNRGAEMNAEPQLLAPRGDLLARAVKPRQPWPIVGWINAHILIAGGACRQAPEANLAEYCRQHAASQHRAGLAWRRVPRSGAGGPLGRGIIRPAQVACSFLGDLRCCSLLSLLHAPSA